MIDISTKTMQSILASMLLRITEQVNKREGSLIRTALSAAAWVIEGLYIDLQYIQKQAYGTSATGDYLDLKAEERGLTRHQATNTICFMLCNVSTLQLGFEFGDSSGYTWKVSSGVLEGPDMQDLYQYRITCQTSGNIATPTGDLRALSFLAGLTTAVFDGVVTPGRNKETDDEFRERYEESLVEIAFAGNVAAYREKMLELEYDVGFDKATIGALQVFSTTDASGNVAGGNVKIYIVDEDMGVASSDLISAVQNAICPMYNGVATGLGYGFAPIGAAVHIVSATSTPTLEIDVTVTLVSSDTIDAISDSIKQNIIDYIKNQMNTWGDQIDDPAGSAMITIREAFIYAASLVQGVLDVTNVVIKKDNVVMSGSASWVTNRQGMEWINIDDVVISVSES